MEDKFKVLRNAEKFVVNRQFDRAVAEYQNLVRTHGEDPSILNTLGDLLLRNGRRGEALDCFHRVAEIFVQSGFVAKGIAIYKKIDELSPGGRDVLGKLGELYERRGMRSDALRYWTALAAHPQSAEDGENLANLHRRIVELDPENPAARGALARALSLRSPSEATGEYLEAARLYLRKGVAAEARDAALKALELDRGSAEAKRLFAEADDILSAAAAAQAALAAPPELAEEAEVSAAESEAAPGLDAAVPEEPVEWQTPPEVAAEAAFVEATPSEETVADEPVEKPAGPAAEEAPEPVRVESFEEGVWEEAFGPRPAEAEGPESAEAEEPLWGAILEEAAELPADEVSETLTVERFDEGILERAFADEEPVDELTALEAVGLGDEAPRPSGFAAELWDEVPSEPPPPTEFELEPEGEVSAGDGVVWEPAEDQAFPVKDDDTTFWTTIDEDLERVFADEEPEVRPDGEAVPEVASEAEEPTPGEARFDDDGGSPVLDTAEPLDWAPDRAPAPASSDAVEGAPDDVLQEIDFYLKLELTEDARRLVEDLMEKYPSDERVLLRAARAGVAPAPPPVVEEGGEAPSFEEEIDAALEELFFEEESSVSDWAAPQTVTEQPIGDSRSDPRAQYDLGLAYREMGMLEDAVAKFEQAYRLFSDAENPEQALLCSSMLSAGYLRLGDFGKTVEWADIGLSLPRMKEFEWKTLEYDRAYALEMMGELEESLTGYRRILDTDPNFRDVRSRLERLGHSSI
jgi:tetratricopeptide (TPR) repeat protein